MSQRKALIVVCAIDLFYNVSKEVPLWLSGLRIQHSVHEDEGQSLALLSELSIQCCCELWCKVIDTARIPRCCGCGVGWQL